MALNQSRGAGPQVVALAGGVGGAKLAHGLARILPPGHLTVVVNVGDDFERYGLHISPDLDTVMYTLAEIANPSTGWGLVDESWQALTMMAQYGEDTWFRLGDRDLATHLLRTDALRSGQRLTEITARLAHKLGVAHTILPASDEPMATMVHTREKGILPFQQYFVKYRWQPTVIDLQYEGGDRAQVSGEVRAAVAAADLLVICPSNPLLSVAPILAVAGLRELIEQRQMSCIAVSPLIGGKAVKGPTAKLMREMGHEPSVLGIARFYNGLIDVLVVDSEDQQAIGQVLSQFPALSIFEMPILMKTVADRESVAQRIVDLI
ncbi:MAG: 2-phospho-L-lactate transferase [Chloroflexi bacterium]|nr:2-phospho-L-lactate transferase [Chloroflexota bacterium]